MTNGSCCKPSSCCAPPGAQADTVAGSQPAGAGKASCCAPGPTAAKPAAKSCCAPSPAAETPAASSCCGPPAPACCDSGDATRDMVKEYYGEVLKSSADLQTSCCTAADASLTPEVRAIMGRIPAEITDKFYGCGYPIPAGIKGLRVLDLGCGTGRDCYTAAALAGPEGFVTGVDMTDAQLEVAQRYVDEWTQSLGYPKSTLRFVKGTIERLDEAGIEDASVDLVVSNCVINLSPDKPRVLREVYRVLAAGGEMHFSDVYCDRRLPQELRSHKVLVGECLGGALFIEDFYSICREVGFLAPRILTQKPIAVDDPQLRELLGEAQFTSITFRLFKVPGKVVTYKGSIEGHPKSYQLDADHAFDCCKPTVVDDSTASMLSKSWLKEHFIVAEP